jgi:hypothetical protein
MGDRDGRVLGPPSPTKPSANRREVATALLLGGQGRFDERGLEPAFPLAITGRSALASTLVVPGARTGPRGKVGAAGKARHVHTHLGNQRLPDHEGMVAPKEAAQRSDRIATLGTQCPLGQLGEMLRIVFPRDQCLQHRPDGGTHDVRRDARELEVRRLV